MPNFPALASPALTPQTHPDYHNGPNLDLEDSDFSTNAVAPPPLVSPAPTPPRASSTNGQRRDRLPKSVLREQDADQAVPQLLEKLPKVTCEVRARIPTTNGQEMWLHLYHNTVDNKEHMAIVFGPHIRSRSLDAVRPGETERDRMIRGAYTGTLFPGRTHSRLEQIRQEAGVTPTAPSPHINGTPMSPAESSQALASSTEGLSYSSFPENLDPPLVRIHSECYTGETVWSSRCDCGEQLDEAARLMSLPAPSPSGTPVSESPPTRLEPAGGVIVYLRQEGRGIGLLSKLKAYNLQDLGHDTMEANLLLRHPGDARSYGLATAILLDLGLGGERGIRLLTNNPDKIRAVEGPNKEVRVAERVPMIPLAWTTDDKGIRGAEVEKYLATKGEKFHHMFTK